MSSKVCSNYFRTMQKFTKQQINVKFSKVIFLRVDPGQTDGSSKFHVDKCGVMHYGRTNDNHSYKMNSKTLKVVNEERDLGIIFQDDLKFNKHISTKVQKANSMLGLIIRSFDYLDKNSYIRLYKAMIRPQLEYGNAVWHPYLRKDIDSIEAVQKRFTKLIPGLRDLSYQDRLKHLKLPSLAHRRRRGDIILCFKIIKGLDDIPC